MNFELVEGTFVRKSQKIFGFLLTNSYVPLHPQFKGCSQIVG